MENREPEYLVSEKVLAELKRIFNDLHKIYLPIQLCGSVMALGLLIEKIDHDMDLFEYYLTHPEHDPADIPFIVKDLEGVRK